LVKRRETYKSAYLENTEICLLSPHSFDDLADSAEFENKFDVVFYATAQAGKLANREFITNCMKQDCLIFIFLLKILFF